MGYINVSETGQLSCTHPMVKKITQCGRLGENKMVRVINLSLIDGAHHEFVDDGKGKAIENAETFLQSIEN